MKITCIILYGILLIFLLIEKRRLDRCRASFLHVIHVNGIRGKTSACRLIDAALREKYRVYTKTTGTDPRVIGVDGVDRPLKRRGGANIREQMAVMHRARREGAEIVILECMAVNPQLQQISQEQIVKGDIGVITNVRFDHIFEMGETLEEIARSLCGMIPKNGRLFTGAAEQAALIERQCRERGAEMTLCPPSEQTQNDAIARAVAKSLGLSNAEIDAGFSKIQRDFGAVREYPLLNKNGETLRFLNLFSVNDPQSTLLHLRDKDASQVYFLYNSRWDRPDRLVSFARYFFPHWQGSTVFLMGDSSALTRRLLRKTPGLGVIRVRRWQDCLDLPANALLVGIGNIKGGGYSMIQQLDREGRGE